MGKRKIGTVILEKVQHFFLRNELQCTGNQKVPVFPSDPQFRSEANNHYQQTFQLKTFLAIMESTDYSISNKTNCWFDVSTFICLSRTGFAATFSEPCPFVRLFNIIQPILLGRTSYLFSSMTKVEKAILQFHKFLTFDRYIDRV